MGKIVFLVKRSKGAPKPAKPPVWWKNTYFWIAGLLVFVGLYGLFRGQATIRDPGQRPETNLPLWYLAAAVLMALNGVLSHRLTVQHHEEEKES